MKEGSICATCINLKKCYYKERTKSPYGKGMVLTGGPVDIKYVIESCVFFGTNPPSKKITFCDCYSDNKEEKNTEQKEKCDDCCIGYGFINEVPTFVTENFDKMELITWGFRYTFCPHCGHKNKEL